MLISFIRIRIFHPKRGKVFAMEHMYPVHVVFVSDCKVVYLYICTRMNWNKRRVFYTHQNLQIVKPKNSEVSPVE